MTDTDRLAALLDVLREANNVIENNYGPDPTLVYDVKRWQKFQRAVNRANDLAAAGVTGGLDVERLAAALREIAEWNAHSDGCPGYDGGDICTCGWVEIADVARTALDPEGTTLLEIVSARAYAATPQPAEEEGR